MEARKKGFYPWDGKPEQDCCVLIRLSPKDTIGGVFDQSKTTTSSGFGRKPDKQGLL